MGKLDGKVAIITGSTSGMGRDTAYLFAKEGAKVVVTGRNEAHLLLYLVVHAGEICLYIIGCDPDDVHESHDEESEHYGQEGLKVAFAHFLFVLGLFSRLLPQI